MHEIYLFERRLALRRPTGRKGMVLFRSEKEKGAEMKLITRMAAPIVAVAALVGFAESAAACSPGYHKVKIQGNWICATNAPVGTSFAASPHVGTSRAIRTKALWSAGVSRRH
jgi:hypothetical protein